MENNMFIKPIYKCGVCGNEHESVVSRANCELACSKRKEEEAKKAAAAKKRAEKNARLAEIDAAYAAADKLMEAYIKDYGVFTEKNAQNGGCFPDFLSWILEL
jgi:hypothetical protein